MVFQQIVNKIASNPRKLFLIDSIGALLSAFLLGVVLVQLENIIGMPVRVLYFLSSIAGIFAVYSFVCYWKTPKSWKPFLRIIAVANLIYCCISIGLVIYCYPQLTNLGVIYFLLEFAIVITLISIEFKTITQ